MSVSDLISLIMWELENFSLLQWSLPHVTVDVWDGCIFCSIYHVHNTAPGDANLI